MQTFFTSDQHFSHARINELAGRPFSSVEEMNETIIERWNERITDGDLVFVLGDVVMGTFVESIKLIERLNGVKLLIPGNHDRVHPTYQISDKKRVEAYELYRSVGFRILPLTTFYTTGTGIPFMLSHFPYEGDSHDQDRHVEYRPERNPDIEWLVHGHVHEKWKINGKQINVGVDVWDFYPVSYDEIQNLIKANSK